MKQPPDIRVTLTIRTDIKGEFDVAVSHSESNVIRTDRIGFDRGAVDSRERERLEIVAHSMLKPYVHEAASRAVVRAREALALRDE